MSRIGNDRCGHVIDRFVSAATQSQLETTMIPPTYEAVKAARRYSVALSGLLFSMAGSLFSIQNTDRAHCGMLREPEPECKALHAFQAEW